MRRLRSIGPAGRGRLIPTSSELPHDPAVSRGLRCLAAAGAGSSTSLKRVTLSYRDFADAIRFAQRLLNEGEYSDAPKLDLTESEALHLALVVSYARPFKCNNKAKDVSETLPAEFLKGLTTEQQSLHKLLLTLRDQELAHSDPGPAHLQIWVGAAPTSGTAAMRASSYRGGLSEEGIRAAGLLAREMLRRCELERRRIIPTLPPGETF